MIRSLFLGAVLSLSMAVAPALAQTSTQSTTTGKLSAADQTFVKTAASAGLAEVDLAKVAQTRASSQQVKDFAEMMIRDHSKANEELTKLAREKGVAVPTQMTDKSDKTRKELSELSGQKFDARFMSVMVQDHTKAVNLFEREAKRGQDKDLKAFADNALPVIKKHLDKAQSLVQQASVQQY